MPAEEVKQQNSLALHQAWLLLDCDQPGVYQTLPQHCTDMALAVRFSLQLQPLGVSLCLLTLL